MALAMCYWSNDSYDSECHIGGNQEKAAYWMNESAKNGFSRAFYIMGYFYQKGIGVKANLQKAINWYKKGAEVGQEDSQVSYGDMFTEDRFQCLKEHDHSDGNCKYDTIVAKDIEQAKYWWKKAAEQGNTYAEDKLQKIYE